MVNGRRKECEGLCKRGGRAEGVREVLLMKNSRTNDAIYKKGCGGNDVTPRREALEMPVIAEDAVQVAPVRPDAAAANEHSLGELDKSVLAFVVWHTVLVMLGIAAGDLVLVAFQ